MSQSEGSNRTLVLAAMIAIPELQKAHAQQIFAAIQHDFLLSTQTVFYCMAGVAGASVSGGGRAPSR